MHYDMFTQLYKSCKNHDDKNVTMFLTFVYPCVNGKSTNAGIKDVITCIPQ